MCLPHCRYTSGESYMEILEVTVKQFLVLKECNRKQNVFPRGVPIVRYRFIESCT